MGSSSADLLKVYVYGLNKVLRQSIALLIKIMATDFSRAFPKLKEHLIKPCLQCNAAMRTLPALGVRGAHPGIETPWQNLFRDRDWVLHKTPAFFCVTGLKTADRVLSLAARDAFDAQQYPPPEPLAAMIESLMIRGRKSRKQRI
jgi:hypothetical protein